MRFADKLAVVTGADSGIGRAAAMRMLSEGAQIVALDIAHASPWPAELSDRVHMVTADLADLSAPELLRDALERLGTAPAILVNAAGILRIAPFWDVTPADWDHTIAVNLRSVFFVTQTVSRLMADARVAGRVVNVSSVHAVVSEPNAAPYTASKGGLEAMTRTIATELAPLGITVNCVRPGATRTRMSEAIYTEAILNALAGRIPSGTVASPDWVANAICYLASDESVYTTGACLDVDGGYAMNGALPGVAYQ
jgi:NAD(P)-dependent dehydrogenase (short-subunit alcohol dehydrogenase family)